MRVHGVWKAIFVVACAGLISIATLQGCPSNPTTETTTEATTETTTEATTETTTEATTETTTEPTVEPTTEPKVEPSIEPAVETTTEPTTEATTDGSAEGNPEATVETSTEPTAEAIPEAAGQQKFSIRLRSLNPQVPQQTFAGAKVCEEGTQNCTNADANADGSLMLDIGKEVYVSVEGASSAQPIFPLRVPIKMPATEQTFVFYVFLNQEVQGLAGVAQVQVDPAKGMLGIRALDTTTQPKDGVSFTMDPSSGQGPFYLGLTGLPDRTLTKTSLAGTAFFANTTPATPFLIKGAHASLSCKGISIAHTDANGDLKLTTKAGTLTTTSVTCQ